jgi:hypothetical protein
MRIVALFLVAALIQVTAPCSAAEILVNGNFETGNFAGWSVANQAGGSGNFFVDAVGSTTPAVGFLTAGNGSGGAFYAVSDTTGPGTHAILQSFSIASNSIVQLSFQMFANNQAGVTTVNPAGLDFTANPNQHARVDILTAGASALSTNPLDIITTLYLGADAGPNPHAFSNYSFDLTALLGGGGNFQIRFGQVDNQGQFNLGVDNVSLDVTSAPEPASMLAWGLIAGIGAVGYRLRKRKLAA